MKDKNIIKMTYSDIVKALEHCTTVRKDCRGCPADGKGCIETAMRGALHLIKHQNEAKGEKGGGEECLIK